MTRSAVLKASLNHRGWKNEAQEDQEDRCWNKPESEKGESVLRKKRKVRGKRERVGRF